MPNAFKLLAALATFALAAAAMPAAAQQAPRPQVVNQFDDLTIRYLLDDLRADWDVERAADGNLVYRASAEGDVNFTMKPHRCTPGAGCTGLVVVALFTGVRIANLAQFDAYLHAFNDRYLTAKLVRAPNGTIALQTYINATGGVSYRNVQDQMLVFGENIVATSRALAQFEAAQ